MTVIRLKHERCAPSVAVMPFAEVYLRQGSAPEYRRNISAAILHAMVEVLHIPDDDQFHVFHELSPDDLIYQPASFGIERGERFMFIKLFFNHRSDEQKQALFAALVDNLKAQAGVARDDVALVVVETGSANWWISGRVVNPVTGYDERMGPSH